jgi:hypothetical protein
VGIALELYHQEIVANGGLAGRFDVLLRQWQTLETLNQQAMDRWDKRLNGQQETKLWDKLLQPKLSFKQGMTWGSIIAAVLLIMWLLMGRGCQVGNTTITQEVGEGGTAAANTGGGVIINNTSMCDQVSGVGCNLTIEK